MIASRTRLVDMETDADQDWTNNPWTLYMPDGSRVFGGVIAGSAASQRIMDRNGNYIDLVNILSDPNYNNHNTVYIVSFRQDCVTQSGQQAEPFLECPCHLRL